MALHKKIGLGIFIISFLFLFVLFLDYPLHWIILDGDTQGVLLLCWIGGIVVSLNIFFLNKYQQWLSKLKERRTVRVGEQKEIRNLSDEDYLRHRVSAMPPTRPEDTTPPTSRHKAPPRQDTTI